MARYQPYRRTLEAHVSGLMSPGERARAVARLHRQKVTEIENQQARQFGAVLPSNTIVDGRKGAPPESVNPDSGVIVTQWSLLKDLLEFVDNMLVMHSPHLKGDYAKSHRLFADGVEADGWESAPPAKEYIFISTLPYSRKIERGQSDQAPDGVYEGVAALAAGRYGNMAWIRFTFRSVSEDYGSVALGGKNGGKKASAEKRAAYNAHNENRFPAIRIYWK